VAQYVQNLRGDEIAEAALLALLAGGAINEKVGACEVLADVDGVLVEAHFGQILL
jgi:hypothetical protein